MLKVAVQQTSRGNGTWNFKSFVLFDESFKSTLRTEKLTTRDSRAVERKNLEEEKLEEAFSFLKDNFFNI